MSQGLILEGVHFGYDGAPILDNIHLHVPPGQFVSLLGASGSGKSTLLRLAAGLLEPARGRLHWAGRPLKGPGLERGVVFQDYALFPWMTVVDNLALAIGKARPRTPSAARRQEAHHALARVGLDDIGDKYPFELSGGMRQRAAIARALAIGSPLLLMDEPFGALDPVNRARLQDVLLDVWETAEPKTTVLFVTHDVDEALYLGQRVVILGTSPGRVIADLNVPFPRHRDRRALFASAEFQLLREQIAETLADDTLRQLAPA